MRGIRVVENAIFFAQFFAFFTSLLLFIKSQLSKSLKTGSEQYIFFIEENEGLFQ